MRPRFLFRADPSGDGFAVASAAPSTRPNKDVIRRLRALGIPAHLAAGTDHQIDGRTYGVRPSQSSVFLLRLER
jgi:hypothetical protein